MYRLILWIRDGENRLWVRPAIGAALAIVFALLATLANYYVPDGVLPDIERDTVEGLLKVIASSMLAVTIFSLSIMVAAFASTATSATPRATELVAADKATHNAISAFISAFIFSVVGLTVLGLRLYHSAGRFILFICTMLVLAYLIVVLIGWVKTLSRLGRISNTLQKIETAAAEAMADYKRSPSMGAQPPPPHFDGMAELKAPRVTYLRHINMAALQELADDAGVRLHLRVRPGSLVHPAKTLLFIEGDQPPATGKLLDAFVFGEMRSYDQDPRFGLIVLSEVAQRALSPAVNDPGTAIAVMNAMTRVIVDSSADEGDERKACAALTLIGLDEDDFIHAPFDPIARDGAGCLEVQVRMQKLLAAIAENGLLVNAVRRQAAMALQRADAALALVQDKQQLHRLYTTLHANAP